MSQELPRCSGGWSHTDCGDEFDCDAVHGQECEDCLANYSTFGGRWHPETGKQVSRARALKLYGKPGKDNPVGPNGALQDPPWKPEHMHIEPNHPVPTSKESPNGSQP